jgi:hypothetical protein
LVKGSSEESGSRGADDLLELLHDRRVGLEERHVVERAPVRSSPLAVTTWVPTSR